MAKDTAAPEIDDENDAPSEPIIQQIEFTCDRCGYKYMKNFDREPFLCNRCMRYIAKKVWTAVKTIQPANSTPAVPES